MDNELKVWLFDVIQSIVFHCASTKYNVLTNAYIQ